MSARIPPCRKQPKQILEDLLEGYHDVALVGPHCAVRYLDTFFRQSNSTPRAVCFFAYDLLAESCFANDDMERCLAAVKSALEYLEDAREGLPREFKESLPGLTFLERGISALAEQGDAKGARDLCDRALDLGLGAHYQRKKESLNWADGDDE